MIDCVLLLPLRLLPFQWTPSPELSSFLLRAAFNTTDTRDVIAGSGNVFSGAVEECELRVQLPRKPRQSETLGYLEREGISSRTVRQETSRLISR